MFGSPPVDVQVHERMTESSFGKPGHVKHLDRAGILHETHGNVLTLVGVNCVG